VISRAHLAKYGELQYTPASIRPAPACCAMSPANPPSRTRLGAVHGQAGPTLRCGSAPVWRRWARPSRSLVRIAWNPTQEPQHSFEQSHPHLLAACKRRMEAAAADRPATKPRPDSHLTALERQGVLQPPRFTWPLERQDAYSFVELRTDPVHPELDVVPPAGASGCFIRMAPSKHWVRRSEPLACVHLPDGRWTGTLTLERLAHLRARWDAAQSARPDLFGSLKAGSFADEVAGLLLDWEARTRKMPHNKLAQRCDSAPAPLMEAILAASGAAVELLASPLDVHPCSAAYLSARERDQLFGAGWDAYRHRWTGVGFAHPSETKEDVLQAVRWALASAREAANDQRPVLTFMLLPDWPTADHAQYLAFPEAALLARLPHTMYKGAALSWTGHGATWSYRGSALPQREAPGYVLVAVGNEAGRQWLVQRQIAELAEWRELPRKLGMPAGSVPWPWRSAGGGARALDYDWACFATTYETQLLDWQSRAPTAVHNFKPPRKLVAAARHTHSLATPWLGPPPELQEELLATYSVSCNPRYEWGEAF